MRAEIWPTIACCAAFGLLLAAATPRTRATAVAATVVAALLASVHPPPEAWRPSFLVSAWTLTLTSALTILASRSRPTRILFALGILVGVSVGGLAALAGRPMMLTVSLPATLLCLPTASLLRAGHGMVVKVIAGWLVAVAALALGLMLAVGPTGAAHLD